MVLPVQLANLYYEKMSFYSCTVSNFEQYTLAEFIEKGYFEKHINRMRLYYARQRQKIINIINDLNVSGKFSVRDNCSGLHFLLKIDTKIKDSQLKEKLLENDIKILSLSDYYFTDNEKKEHLFIINYSNINEQKIKKVIEIINAIIEKER